MAWHNKPKRRIAKRRAKITKPASKVIYKVYFSGPNASFGQLQEVSEKDFYRYDRVITDDEPEDADKGDDSSETAIEKDDELPEPVIEIPIEDPIPMEDVPPVPAPAPDPAPPPPVVTVVDLKYTDGGGTTYDLGDDQCIATMPLPALNAMFHRDSSGKIMLRLANGLCVSLNKGDVEKRFKANGMKYLRRTRIKVPTRGRRYGMEDVEVEV